MLPFTKLKTSIDLPNSDFGDNLIYYGENKSIGFFKIELEVENQLLQILPTEYRRYFSASVMRIEDSYIRPHTDSDRTVSINFYVQTEKAITKFFNKKETTVEIEQVSGQTNGFVYQEIDLLSAGSFIAVPGDIWVLDVTKIHAVINPVGSRRTAYTLSSNTLSYVDTIEILTHLIESKK